MSDNQSRKKVDFDLISTPVEYDPDVARYTDPFYEMTETGELRFRDTAAAKLFRDTTAGSPGEVQKILAEEGSGGVMRRILTDDRGVLRAAILAKAMAKGMEEDNIQWLRFAMKIIESSISEGVRSNGGSVPVSAGLAVQITGPIQRILQSVDGEG